MSRLLLRCWREEDTASVRETELQPGKTSIGRGPDNVICLNDTGASRRHAHVRFDGNQAVVVDDKSSNGTWQHGRRITSQEIRPGDRFKIGSHVFELVESAKSAAAGSTRVEHGGPPPVPPPSAHSPAESARQGRQCHRCGTDLPPDAAFCDHCGLKLARP
ncbi:MAG: FHA domain-containing protein [Acidobacteria bacterium]|nr:FHA domain-containing protein [Acidobacteriota bacterium]